MNALSGHRVPRDVQDIELDRAAPCVDLGEEPEHLRRVIVLITRNAVACDTAPGEDPGDSRVDQSADLQIGTRQPHHVHHVFVDEQAVLKRQRLTSDREVEIESPAVVTVEIGKDLAEVAFEEQRADCGVQLRIELLRRRAWGAKRIRGKRPVLIEGPDPYHHPLRRCQEQIPEEVGPCWNLAEPSPGLLDFSTLNGGQQGAVDEEGRLPNRAGREREPTSQGARSEKRTSELYDRGGPLRDDGERPALIGEPALVLMGFFDFRPGALLQETIRLLCIGRRSGPGSQQRRQASAHN